MDLVINYFKKILPHISKINGTLNVCFIGGEPLLKKNLIKLIINEITSLTNIEDNKNVKITFNLDTNSMLLTRDFILEFPNLTVNTTLSLQSDHDTLRSKSFFEVVNSLKNLKDVFDGIKYKLIIRYNVHHGNVKQIEQFIVFLNSLGLKFVLDFQNIMNSSSANFINKLSDDEFEEIYVNYIVPILIDHSIKAKILPEYGLSRHCSCIGKFDCKFYSNGQIVLCDAFAKKSVNTPKIEMTLLPEMCIKCFDFPYCGGPKPCEMIKCTGIYDKKNAARNRIIRYVETFLGDS